MTVYQVHPAAEIFPLMSERELADLTADIAENGLREPIKTWGKGGPLIDGRNRLRACESLGIEASEEWADPHGDPVAYVLSLNLHRRHLDPSQQGMVVARAETIKHGGDRRKIQDANLHLARTRLCEQVGCSPRTAASARKVLDQGAPGLSEMVERGEVPVSVAAEVATLPQAEQVEAVAGGPQAVRDVVKPHVSHNSGNNEWYTPEAIINRARKVMGSIDLDPASSEAANETVKAEHFYTIDDNGLEQDWRGNVWLNPPYAAGLVDKFIAKLKSEVKRNRTKRAVVLVNNATDTKWFAELASIAEAIHFPTRRIKFWNPEKSSCAPLQGQAIVYIGDALSAQTFFDVFTNGINCDVV